MDDLISRQAAIDGLSKLRPRMIDTYEKDGDVFLKVRACDVNDMLKGLPSSEPQKPVSLMKQLITIFTDPGDVVIDPCFGSGSTARACQELGRNFYGFEINHDFYNRAVNEMCKLPETNQIDMNEYMEAMA